MSSYCLSYFIRCDTQEFCRSMLRRSLFLQRRLLFKINEHSGRRRHVRRRGVVSRWQWLFFRNSNPELDSYYFQQ